MQDRGRAPSGLMAFAGDWSLERRIGDFRAGRTFRFAGRACFRPAAEAEGALLEEEAGLLRCGRGPALPARRAALWRAAGPGRIAVVFPDGRDFHAFALAPRAEARHLCPPDGYRALYDFRRWPEWWVAWRATGPAKDYLSLARYRPLAGCAGAEAGLPSAPPFGPLRKHPGEPA